MLYQTNQEPYKISDLSLPGMRDFARRLELLTDLFTSYYTNMNNDFPQPACESTCRKLRLCALQFIKTNEYQACMMTPVDELNLKTTNLRKSENK